MNHSRVIDGWIAQLSADARDLRRMATETGAALSAAPAPSEAVSPPMLRIRRIPARARFERGRRSAVTFARS
jgi:hypothetical protein